jgi:hypothetical protein
MLVVQGYSCWCKLSSSEAYCVQALVLVVSTQQLMTVKIIPDHIARLFHYVVHAMHVVVQIGIKHVRTH